jgi:hypothetical protein
MRLLVATQSFAQVGGTETYVLTVADHLQRLGHEVAVLALHTGDMSRLALGRGVEVVQEVGDADEPDVVLAQDSVVAYQLADRWPRVPQVFVCHSELYDVQQPPLVPGLAAAVVVLNDRTRRRVESLAGSFRVVRLSQPVDTERLVPRRPPADTPRRALLLGNYLAGEPYRLIAETWAEKGVEVVRVGTTATPTLTPEIDISEADIVVGKGRAVLDAMSCGRPAYVYDMWGGDGWVTEATYAAIEADGVSGLAFADVFDAERLRADLAAYDADMGRVNRLLATSRNGAQAHAQALVTLLTEVLAEPPRPVTEARELARMVRLRWRAESELVVLRQQFHAAAGRSADELTVARVERDELRERLQTALDEKAVLEVRLGRTRMRARRLRARHRRLLSTGWVRLGRRLRFLPPGRRPRGTTRR